jgi:hypothetical protein
MRVVIDELRNRSETDSASHLSLCLYRSPLPTLAEIPGLHSLYIVELHPFTYSAKASQRQDVVFSSLSRNKDGSQRKERSLMDLIDRRRAATRVRREEAKQDLRSGEDCYLVR